MTTILDLVLGGGRALPAISPDEDPLVTDDALLEAQVIGLLNMAAADVVAVLLDLRMAMQLDTGSAGLLVARGAVRASFDYSLGIDNPPAALPVLSSVSRVDGRRVSIRLEIYPAGELLLSGFEAEAFMLGVPGMPEGVPDYTEPGWSWSSSLIPQWQSECEVLGFSSR